MSVLLFATSALLLLSLGQNVMCSSTPTPATVRCDTTCGDWDLKCKMERQIDCGRPKFVDNIMDGAARLTENVRSGAEQLNVNAHAGAEKLKDRLCDDAELLNDSLFGSAGRVRDGAEKLLRL